MIGVNAAGRKDGISSFRQLKKYIEDETKTGGEVWSWGMDDPSDPRTWSAEMEGVAALAPRVHDPIHHVIVSWPADERPTHDELRQVVRETAAGLGYDMGPYGHQIVAAPHHDTGNTHLHIIVNRVHPLTSRPHHVEFGDAKTAETMRRIEYEHGWQEDRGIMELARLPSGKVATMPDGTPIVVHSDYRAAHAIKNDAARKMEQATGEVSFVRYAKEQAGPLLKDAVKSGDWQIVHRVAAEHGIRIEKKGGGYVVTCTAGAAADAGLGCKASDIGLRSQHWKKLGEYQPSQGSQPQPRKSYDAGVPEGFRDHEAERQVADKLVRTEAAHARAPNRKRYTQEGAEANELEKLRRAQERDQLYAGYRVRKSEIRERQSADKQEQFVGHCMERDDLHEQINAERKQAWARWREVPEHDRIHPRVMQAIQAVDSAKRKRELQLQQAADRRELADEYRERYAAIPSWREYLRATAGDQMHPDQGAAERTLRGMRYRDRDQGDDDAQRPRVWSATGEAREVSENILSALRVRAQESEGVVMYFDAERQRMIGRDHGDRIDVLDTSSRSLEMLIAVAGERFGGRIELTGSDDFKIKAAEVAARLGVRVSNPELQHTWDAARKAQKGRGEAPANPQEPQTKPEAPAQVEPQAPAPEREPPNKDRLKTIQHECDLVHYATTQHGYRVADQDPVGRRVMLVRDEPLGEQTRIVVERRGMKDAWYDPRSGASGDLIAFRRRETGDDHIAAATALDEYAQTAPERTHTRVLMALAGEHERSRDATARRQRAARAEPEDKTLAEVRRQIEAIGAEWFEVGVRNPAKGVREREWSVAEIESGLPWLKRQNAQREHVYIRPHPQTRCGAILVDDIELADIDRMKADGMTPALVVETSPKCYQAWLKIPGGLDKTRAEYAEELTLLARRVAERYEADPGAAKGRQYGRMAGFVNPKPEYETAKGYPFSRVHEHTGKEAPALWGMWAEVRQDMEQRRDDAKKTMQIYAIDRDWSAFGALPAPGMPADPRALEIYRTIIEDARNRYGRTIDYSRADWSAATTMMRQGWTHSDVVGAMREASPGLGDRKGDYAEQYILRTATRAEVRVELERRGAPEDHARDDAGLIVAYLSDQAATRREPLNDMRRAEAEVPRAQVLAEQATKERERAAEAECQEQTQWPGLGR